ncbi:MAG TPA: hypothetical protein VGV09_04035 [Steroidobacteraceae bacterium]|nr:hypothetical protein [Steroidobacteraceae bacterium]
MLIALALALAVSLAHAQQSSALRVRAFAALPNWTGFWETDLSAALNSHDFSGLKPDSAAAAIAAYDDEPGGDIFFALTKLAAKPPYNPEWEQQYQMAVTTLKNSRGHSKSSVTEKTCTSSGFPDAMDSIGPFQWLVTPEETLFLFHGGDVRHIYTDGRSHPEKADLWPTPEGDSVGHWEGETLIVDTVERQPGPIVPPGPTVPVLIRSPGLVADLSEQAHFVERIRMVGTDALQDDLTIEDPQRFTRPWHISMHYKRAAGVDRMILSSCEHDRDIVVNGKIAIAPP